MQALTTKREIPTMIETWKDVPGYEDRYQVSDLGRVKSLPNSRRKTDLLMKQQPIGRCGHLSVRLTLVGSDGWEQTTHYTHTLVLRAFVGEPEEGLEGCHNDGNELNNRLSNLRWGTPKSNQADRKLHGTDNGGSRNPRAKLNEIQVRQIKTRLKAGESDQSIALDYSVSHRTIKSIRLNQNWSHIV